MADVSLPCDIIPTFFSDTVKLSCAQAEMDYNRQQIFVKRWLKNRDAVNVSPYSMPTHEIKLPEKQSHY